VTKEHIAYLWGKLYPHARWRYEAEFRALRAGTTVGEIERKARQKENQKKELAREARRQSA
jgi:hypothetical protein